MGSGTGPLATEGWELLNAVILGGEGMRSYTGTTMVGIYWIGDQGNCNDAGPISDKNI